MKQVLRWTVVALCLVFFVLAARQHAEALTALPASIDAGWLLLSVVVLVPLFFLDALGWSLLLRVMRLRLPHWQAIRIWLFASVARYVPGVIWSYAGRAALAKAQGIAPTDCARSMLLEVLLMAMSALIATAPLWDSYVMWNPAMLLLLALTSGLLVAVVARSAVGRRLFTAVGVRALVNDAPAGLASLLCFYLGFWWLMAGAFVLFAKALLPTLALSCQQTMLLGLSFPLSFFIGFITVIAPGGLGVREVSLYGLLLAILPPAEALLLSVSSRLWLMAAEAVAVAVAAVTGRGAVTPPVVP
jgi:hypothetical protein